jgi:hypothetical protein
MILVTIILALYTMEERVSFSGVLIVFLVIVPYLFGLWLLSRTKRPAAIYLVSIIMILISVSGAYLLYDALFLHPDAQSGLVFLTIPVYGFPVVMLTAAAVYIMQRGGEERD